MIYVALGANLPSERYGSPRATLLAAIEALEAAGLRVVARSRWYRSPAYPPSDQPDYVNGVVAIETAFDPKLLMITLHGLEIAFGRVRGAPNAARTLDLDLLAYHDLVSAGEGGNPVLPHPRMAGRAFVLRPLQELAPAWRHPASGQSIGALIAALPPDQVAIPLDDEWLTGP